MATGSELGFHQTGRVKRYVSEPPQLRAIQVLDERNQFVLSESRQFDRPTRVRAKICNAVRKSFLARAPVENPINLIKRLRIFL